MEGNDAATYYPTSIRTKQQFQNHKQEVLNKSDKRIENFAEKCYNAK